MAVLIVDGMSVLMTTGGAAARLDRGYAFSFLTQITAAVKKLKTVGTLVCWEGGFSKRTEILPGYKANRSPIPDLISRDRELLKSLLTHLGADQFHAPGYEADDVIAHLTNTLQTDVIILSADKDLLQLVSPRVSVYQKARKPGEKTVRELITSANFFEKTTWHNPAQYLMAHCAIGDAVDCIPGMPGVSANSINLYFMGAEIGEKKRARIDEFFRDSELYLRNRSLISMMNTRDLPVQRVAGQINPYAAFRLLEEMGFASITGKFNGWFEAWEKANLNTITEVPQNG